MYLGSVESKSVKWSQVFSYREWLCAHLMYASRAFPDFKAESAWFLT